MTSAPRVSTVLRRLWQANAPLTVVALLMLPALAAAGLGLVMDPRLIAGAPAWLKPAKFAASTAVYAVTLAWYFEYIPEWRRTRALVGWVTAIVFVLEVGIIDVQAWRGTTSHFNVSTPLDAVLFGVMGAAILLQTVASAWVAVALWRQPFAMRALGTGLRAGMVLTLLGAASAGLMTMPTTAQVSELSVTRHMATSGAHTVGAPDGGPGLPGTGWSRDHGDLRIPHFVGLHAMQVLPLLALFIVRRTSTDDGVRLVRVAAASYAGLFGLLLMQALRGEGLFSPGPLTAGLFAIWAVTTVAFAAMRTRSLRIGLTRAGAGA